MYDLIECPQCLGTGELIIPVPEANNRMLHNTPCQLCNSTGKVHIDIANDFVFSLNEDVDFE
jgi:hypothetical protein